MKKLILSAAALFAFGFANAQDADTTTGGKGFANGDIFISGQVGFTSNSFGDSKNNTFSIAPRVGFFVSDNIAVGGMIGYTSSTDEDEVLGTTVETKNSELSVGVFGRYYFTPANDFSFFGELGFNYNTNKEEIDGVDEDFTVNGFGIALRPGISYFVSSNFALEASIGALSYETEKADVDGAESNDTFGLNFNMNQVNLGLVYKF